MDVGVNPVIAAERGEAEVGNDEPLRRLRAVVVVGVLELLRLRHDDVDAGLEVAERTVDREGGGDVGVERWRFDRKLALPDGNAARLAQLLDLVAVEAVLEIAAIVLAAAAESADEVAIVDTQDLHGNRAAVDADNGDPALARARQHVGIAGKACERLAVAHVDGKILRLRQRLMHGRRQAGAQGDRIGLAVLQTFDAKLLLGGGQRRLVGAGERDEG